ncbi:hypothetical protein ABLN87_00710 [Ruegeria sp. SCPT10]|uniref:hypothetical protein n=1 Tax=Ruegeria sp. SCP10 TaxID=3141377 RepID=UPI003338BE4B
MAQNRSYHGGLQFDGDADGAIERFSSIVATTLQDYGHLIERKAMLNHTEASIVSSQYLVRLTLKREAANADTHHDRLDRVVGLKTAPRRRIATRPQNRMQIIVSPVSPVLDDPEISELMLAVMLYRMVDICSTRRVEWLSPRTVLTLEQFMSAFDTLAPGKSRDRKQIFQSISGQFAGVDIPEPDEQIAVSNPSARPIQLTDDQLLSIAFRADETLEPPSNENKPFEQIQDNTEDEDRPSDILRLSSWCVTGVIASVSMPIACSMAAVNLIRGEDFRLNTQVLVFSSAIVALNASNAFADVANVLGM